MTRPEPHQLSADEAGFTEYVAVRGASLLRVAYLLTGNHHTAEDLLQTALAGAAKHWERIHSDPDPYLRRSLHNAKVSAWRRHRLSTVPLDSVAGLDALAASETDPTDRLAVEVALGQLTARQRSVLVLRYFEDLTEAQTAEVLGISVNTVKSVHRQALKQMRGPASQLREPIGGPQ